jgi:hypothetical protein
VAATFQQVLLLALAYVEGTGKRHAAWRANFWIEVVAGCSFIFLVACRAELWALTASSLLRAAAILALFVVAFKFPSIARGKTISERFRLWRRHLWPMQWKNLVNNIVGLLTTRLLTPLLLAAQGAVIAGKVGLILSLGSTALSVTSAWPISQTALYASLYHQGNLGELTAVFRRTLFASTSLAAACFLGTGILCEVFRAISPHIDARLPSSAILWPILASGVLAHMAYCFAILLRCQRCDPVVVPNAVLAVITLIVYWYSVWSGPNSFALTYALVATGFAALYLVYTLQFLMQLKRRMAESIGGTVD